MTGLRYSLLQVTELCGEMQGKFIEGLEGGILIPHPRPFFTRIPHPARFSSVKSIISTKCKP